MIRQVLERDEVDNRLLKFFDLDPSAGVEGEVPASYPELVDPDTEDEVYYGTVPFEIQVGIMGQTHTIDCRAVYSATLVQDGSIQALLDGVLGDCEIEYQMITRMPRPGIGILGYRDGRPLAPRWQSFEPGPLLPWDLRMMVRAFVERDAARQAEI
ncbi:hypothetical protein [Tsuneonella dongtanensis]|nr:hypothetical protein [Tsuneonella dongtanensis]